MHGAAVLVIKLASPPGGFVFKLPDLGLTPCGLLFGPKRMVGWPDAYVNNARSLIGLSGLSRANEIRVPNKGVHYIKH